MKTNYFTIDRISILLSLIALTFFPFISSAQLYVASSKVGIGISTPTNILSLVNTAAQKVWIENTASGTVGRDLTIAAGSTVGGTNITGGSNIIQAGLGTGTGASTISFQNGTTLGSGSTLQTMSTKMTILGNGNVGIGATSPQVKLDVQTSNTAGVLKALQLFNPHSATAGDGVSIFMGQANTYEDYGSLITSRVHGIGNQSTLHFQSHKSASSEYNIGLFIGGDGNIGIGTTSPDRSLIVSGGSTGLGIYASNVGLVLKNTSSSNKTWDFSPYGNDLQLNETGGAVSNYISSGWKCRDWNYKSWV